MNLALLAGSCLQLFCLPWSCEWKALLLVDYKSLALFFFLDTDVSCSLFP